MKIIVSSVVVNNENIIIVVSNKFIQNYINMLYYDLKVLWYIEYMIYLLYY
jgi:hypothetical protein